MAWKIEYQKRALKQLHSLDPQIAIRLGSDMQYFASQADPRAFASPLTGNWKGFWRFRMGNYRAICRFDDGKLLILVVKIGHRKEVYE